MRMKDLRYCTQCTSKMCFKSDKEKAYQLWGWYFFLVTDLLFNMYGGDPITEASWNTVEKVKYASLYV